MKTKTEYIKLNSRTGAVLCFKSVFIIKVLVLLLLLMITAAHADTFADYEYTSNGDSTCSIIGYTGPGSDLVIPDILNGLTVTRIGGGAFRYCSGLTSVTIPNSVTSIGAGAFRYCSELTSVTIPDSITSIEDGAFWECFSLTSVTIPDSVTSIGDYAFCECYSLASVTIGNSITSIGDCAFCWCYSLTSFTIPDSVTSIGDYAFWECTGLTSVTIPDGVTSIGDYAFYDCFRLRCIYFKGGPPSLGSDVFYNVSATIYYLSGTTEWGATLGGLAAVVWQSIADVDTNGNVNLLDFYAFAAAWQAVDGVDAEYNPLCDISTPADGVIDTADLDVFALNWLSCPCQG